MSPELIAPHKFGLKKICHTKSSDCYALGMVIYETISGNMPFHEDPDLAVFLRVMEGEHPPQGTRFTKGLWELLEQCWASLPNNRPSIEDVLQCLEMVSNLPGPPSPRTDKEMENSGDWDTKSSSSGVDQEVEKGSGNWGSTNNSGIQNEASDMTVAEGSTTMPSGLGYHILQVSTLYSHTPSIPI